MILLIEDNKTIGQNILDYLKIEGYNVHRETDGLKGCEFAQEKHIDLIILDIMLPQKNGIEILEEVRTRKNIPVIMTTAKGTLNDKEIGFNAGADDYLVKPFDLQELLWRIEALLKRSQISDIYSFENLEINFEDNEAHSNGEEIALTNKEWQILQCLFMSEGHPVSRSDIVETVRGGDSLRENDGKLDVYISTLRKKLRKDLIETVSGFGYKIPKR